MGTLPKDKLAAVLGMLGSDQDGEVLAAARMAERMRRQAGATWHELLMPPAPAPTASCTAARPLGWRHKTVAACRARSGRLTGWERSFLAELAAYTREPSPRQMAVLIGIAAKAA